MSRNRLGGSMFRKTFLSYTAIMIIPILVLCSINAVKKVGEAQNEMHRKHEEDSARVVDGVDNKLKELKRLGEIFGDETWVKKYMLDADVFDGEFDLLKNLEIRKNLRNAVSGSGILSFGAILYPGKQQVISPWGVFDSSYFFASVASFDGEALHKLNAAADDYQLLKLMSPSAIALWGENRTVIPVLQSLEAVNNPRAVLLLFIDSSYMASYIRHYIGGTGPVSISVTAQGSSVFAPEPIQADPDEGVETFTAASQVSDWTYAISYPNERFIGIHNMFALLLALLLSIVIGTLSAYLCAKLSYRPLGILLRKLANTLRVDQLQKVSGTRSELTLIETSIDHLVNENQSLQQALIDYKSAARSNMLLRLLKGYFKDDQQANRMKELGLRFTDETHICAMLVGFHEIYDFSDMERVKKIDTLTFMAVEKALGCRRIDYQLFEVTNVERVIVLSSELPFGGDGVIRTIANEITEELEPLCGTKPAVLAGTLEQGLLGISKSYYAASELLHYRLFSRGALRGGYEDTPAIDYYYPTDWEVQLINNLKIGNLDMLVQIVDEVKGENEKRGLPENAVSKLIASLMETMLRVLNELNIDADIYARQFASKTRERNIEALWEYVYEVGTLICERIRYSNTSSAMAFGNNLLVYVNQNYTSADMSLKKLAEVLHMSVSGVSKTFKEVTGINFYDYVCRLRMELAKELLREKKGEISRIAQLVGYENAYSFKRAFVRYEGIKPDEYAQLTV